MKKIIILIFLFSLNCSNNKVINNHGLNELKQKYSKIEVMKANKNDVLNIIGKPSTISLFDENSWFFIEREKVNQSVFKLGKSKIQKNDILEIVFNERGIVQSKKIYDLNDMNDYKMVKDTNNKKYGSDNAFSNVLKSLEQKINAPKQNRKRD